MKNKEELPMNSDRGKLLCQELTDPARNDQPALSEFSADALMELVVSPRNLERAWRQVKRNRGAPGPDGMTTKQFEAWARENWPAVRQQLLDGTYQPQPVRRRPTCRSVPASRKMAEVSGSSRAPTGGWSPNVLDRLIQQAISQVLTPTFDPYFSTTNLSVGARASAFALTEVPTEQRSKFRRSSGKATPIALTLTSRNSSTGDQLLRVGARHDVLMCCVSRKVHDRRLLQLIGRYLRAGVMVEGVLQPTKEGSPRAPTHSVGRGPLSPLLSNILLDELDKELERRGLKFVPGTDASLVGG